MEGLHVFLFFQIPGKKGFKFHAQPQTGAYSCFRCRERSLTHQMSAQSVSFEVSAQRRQMSVKWPPNLRDRLSDR